MSIRSHNRIFGIDGERPIFLLSDDPFCPAGLRPFWIFTPRANLTLAGLHCDHFAASHAGIISCFRNDFISLRTILRQNAQAGFNFTVFKEINADLTIRFKDRQAHLSQLLNAIQSQLHEKLKLGHI